MPQMAPISWLILFFVFFMIFLMFNIMNYFIYFPFTPSHQMSSKKKISLNWKW